MGRVGCAEAGRGVGEGAAGGLGRSGLEGGGLGRHGSPFCSRFWAQKSLPGWQAFCFLPYNLIISGWRG